METVSIVISAFNEGYRLDRCLTTCTWAHEVIVVDSSSMDDTVTVAKKYTNHIFSRPNNPMLNVNKNFGFGKASGEWILSLDADEELPQALVGEIRSAIEGASVVGFWIPRKNIIFGKWIQHGIWWPDKQLRLFRRNRGKFPGKHVHESIEVDGPTLTLTQPFIHHNYQSVSQFIRKMDTLYTESEVKNLLAADYRLNWYDAVRFPMSDFLKTYFAQEGYKDGLHGLVLSMLQAFYSFIVFVKLWEQSGFGQRDVDISDVSGEFHRAGRDIEYWMLTNQMRRTKNFLLRIGLKLKRHYVAKR